MKKIKRSKEDIQKEYDRRIYPSRKREWLKKYPELATQGLYENELKNVRLFSRWLVYSDIDLKEYYESPFNGEEYGLLVYDILELNPSLANKENLNNIMKEYNWNVWGKSIIFKMIEINNKLWKIYDKKRPKFSRFAYTFDEDTGKIRTIK